MKFFLAFQFPSNGKAYRKRSDIRESPTEQLLKFQFPSNGKAYRKEI